MANTKPLEAYIPSPIDHLIDPTEAETKATDVYRQIRTAIRSGDLKPGESLRIERLREKYITSMSPCREALARLVGEAFVVAEGKKGFRVREVSEQDFKSIFELRNKLELDALSNSIDHRNDAWEARVVGRLYLLSKHKVDQKNTTETRETLHRAFHLELISQSDSPWLLRFYNQLANHVERYRRIFLGRNLYSDDYIERIDAEHQQLAEYSIAGDNEAACSLMTQHRAGTYDQVVDAIRKSEFA